MRDSPVFFYMKFTIKTIGCKVNTYESNRIKSEMLKKGFEFIDVDKKNNYKDIEYYIINTCSVTAIADKKSRQMIHQAKKLNPNIVIVATGCYVNSHINDIDKEIDIVVTNEDKCNIIDIIVEHYNKHLKNVFNENIAKQNKYKTKNDVLNNIREFIKIQDGCNQYCTYCIIPYLRGNIKSRDINEIIDEIREKVILGTKEIVLTGIHLSSFGLDKINMTYESEGAIDISRKEILKLIDEISKIEVISNAGENLKVERLRIGSLEPRIIDENFIKSLMENEIGKIFCPNFCLSLQSGSNIILKKMNRHYTVEEFENAVNIIRKYMPKSTITTDIIVGFPGETEENFNETLEFVKKIKFYNPNIFPYSRRKGTKADTFENQLTKEEKHERVLKLISLCDGISKEIENEILVNDEDILIEEMYAENGIKYGVGYSKEYIRKVIVL